MLCDSLGLPCSLVRGGYSRHWNIVNSIDTVQSLPTDTQESPTPNPQSDSAPNPPIPNREESVSPNPHSNVTAVPQATGNPNQGNSTPVEGKPAIKDYKHALYLVDLMFNPGMLLPAFSPQAVQYQHLV